MKFHSMIKTVDTHTAGEPTRIVLSGLPKLKGNTVKEQRDFFKRHYDNIRTRLTYEPRGFAGMLCAVLVPPCHPEADFGVFYMDDVQYLDMCGHASIGTGTALQEIGLVPPEKKSEYIIETPAGLVKIRNHFNGDFVDTTTIRNVNSYVIKNEIMVDIDEVKNVPVNIAYGGNIFAIVPAERFDIEIVPNNIQKIKDYSRKVRDVCKQKGYQVNLVQWYHPPKTQEADLCVIHSSGYGSPDRSPGGTGMSAKLAWLYENDRLKIDEPFTHDGLFGVPFIGRILGVETKEDRNEFITEITSKARITGFHTFVFDEDDELVEGFLIEAE